MDKETIEKLADSAQSRAKSHYAKFLVCLDEVERAGYLNDAFYWFGHEAAYRGVLAGMEIQGIMEAEKDAEPTCP
jgi:type IV secretory pathway TraG/TraD family ATPase VirD4